MKNPNQPYNLKKQSESQNRPHDLHGPNLNDPAISYSGSQIKPQDGQFVRNSHHCKIVARATSVMYTRIYILYSSAIIPKDAPYRNVYKSCPVYTVHIHTNARIVSSQCEFCFGLVTVTVD